MSGGGSRPLIGMVTFATGLALPFFLLALFPSYLKRMPRSGGWMARVKVVMGFIILAFSLKYLASLDAVLRGGFLTRERFLAAKYGPDVIEETVPPAQDVDPHYPEEDEEVALVLRQELQARRWPRALRVGRRRSSRADSSRRISAHCSSRPARSSCSALRASNTVDHSGLTLMPSGPATTGSPDVSAAMNSGANSTVRSPASWTTARNVTLGLKRSGSRSAHAASSAAVYPLVFFAVLV